MSRNCLHITDTLVALFAKATFVFVCLPILLIACDHRKTEIADKAGEAEEGYSMFTTNAHVLVSDSGITQYRMKAQEWYIYEGAENPRWYFPKGFFAEQIDTLMHRKASLKSDTAYHYTKREQWEFIGHVVVENPGGDTFLAKHLIWDKASKKVSSEDSVTVITPDRRLTGTGFTAEQDFSRYTFYNNSGQVVMPEQEEVPEQDGKLSTETPKNQDTIAPYRPLREGALSANKSDSTHKLRSDTSATRSAKSIGRQTFH